MFKRPLLSITFYDLLIKSKINEFSDEVLSQKLLKIVILAICIYLLPALNARKWLNLKRLITGLSLLAPERDVTLASLDGVVLKSKR